MYEGVRGFSLLSERNAVCRWHKPTMKTHLGNHLTSVLAALALISVIQPIEASIWITNGPMTTARYDHTATLLSNGKVLVVGGTDAGEVVASAELYDPSTGAWVPTGAMAGTSMEHTATLLPNGKVLVVSTDLEVQLYDPATGTWTTTG